MKLGYKNLLFTIIIFQILVFLCRFLIWNFNYHNDIELWVFRCSIIIGIMIWIRELLD